MKQLAITAAALLALGALAFTGDGDYETAVAEVKHYCSMVALYQADKSKGWPPYNNDIQCNN